MTRAVFGGSFDPAHLGHVAMVDRLLADGAAAEVVLVPAAHSPFKEGHAAGPEHRLAMLELAFASRTEVVIDTRELSRPGPSYSVTTLEEMAADHPEEKLLLVLGQDNLSGLPRWRKVDRLLALADLYVFPRGDDLTEADALRQLHAGGVHPRSVRVAEGFGAPVSSRRGRAMLAGHEGVADLVPAAVAAYIAAHGLYVG